MWCFILIHYTNIQFSFKIRSKINSIKIYNGWGKKEIKVVPIWPWLESLVG